VKQLRVGTSHEMSFEVQPEHTVSFVGLPPVLATPWLIWHVERAAMELLQASLETNEQSVGTYVELEHHAPAQPGDVVTCRARIVHTDGQRITFAVEASLETKRICRGLHRRRVVDVSRLARRLARDRPTDR
jgi:fluoroacetyl-CoA thioesterase